MARLGDFVREECHPLGAAGARQLRLIGVSNEHGLHPSSRDASDDLARYQRIDRDWFAYNPMRVNVGSIGVADDESKVGFTSPDYVVFSCRPGLEPAYLLHFLKSDYGLDAVSNQCSGAVRKRLYFTGLAEIELPIPSVARQREVVRKLDEAKAAVRFICEENSDRHELPKLKQAILQEAITGRLTAGWRAANPKVEPASQLLARIRAEKARIVAAKKLRPEKPLPPIPADEIPFAVPEGWEWCRLIHVILGTESGWSPACLNEAASEGRWGVLKTTAVQVCEYLPHENKELPASLQPRPEHEVAVGDILMTRAGPANRVGICALVRETRPKLMISDKIVRFRPVLVRGEYLELFSNTPEFQKLIEASKQGMAQSQVNISQENLKATVLPLPPLAEQTEIVARVEGLMERCRELEAEIALSRAHAEALLQAVLREAFAPAATPVAASVSRPSIKPLAYLLQFLPALARAAGGKITLEQLNRAAACLFLPKAELLPLAEKIAGAEARDHFAGLDQAYEDGAFLAALRTLLKAKAFVIEPESGAVPLLSLTDNLPPIMPEIDADARFLAPILERIPEKAVARSAARHEAPRVREVLLSPA